jgi:hypothetical protein
MNLLPIVFSPLQPSENDEFSIDVGSMLAAKETIVSANVSGAPSGLTISNTVITKNIVTVWVTGGSANVSYLLTYTITTSVLDTLGHHRAIVVEAVLNCRA